MSRGFEDEGTLATVARLVVPHFADWCAIDLLEPDGTLRRVALEHRDPRRVRRVARLAARFPLGPCDPESAALAIQTRRATLLAEVPDELLVRLARGPRHLRVLRTLGISSCIVAPLVARQRLLGAISFACAESRRRYGTDDLRLAEELALRAALAVDNARLVHEAQAERALFDMLLGAAPIGLAFFDRERRYLRLSAWLAELHRRPIEAHLGRTVRDALPAELAGPLDDELRRVFQTGEPLVERALAWARPGPGAERSPLVTSLYPLRDPAGAIVAVAAIFAGLSARPQAAPKRAPEPAGEPLADVALRGLRVLVVEDDADARELVTCLLETRGARVRAAGSAGEALPLVESFRPAVLVSDIGMPGTSGYDLIRAVRELGRERGGGVPAVALTAYAQADDRRRALGAGYQLHLAKPIEAPRLVEAVARLARWSDSLE
jgi:CheY-like chemotaxis protein